MTSMWKRGSQRQYPRTAIAAVCWSEDHHNASVRPDCELLSSGGSPS
jgi:hypothetical protein